MKPGMKRPMLAAIAAAMSAMAVHAALAPAALFSDHCVLQRGKKVPVWGKANPGAASRRAIGVATFSGMVASVVVGTLLVPGLYVLFCGRCNNK